MTRSALAVFALVVSFALVVHAEGDKTLEFAEAPADWKKLEPRGGFGPKLEWELPAAEGEKDAAKVTVHYFSGSGGDFKSNLERWASQFTDAEGKALAADKAKVEDLEANGVKMKLAELVGTWTPPSFGPMAKKNDPKPDSTMLAAYVEGPDGPWFVRLTGSTKTVTKHRDAYVKWLKSVKAVEKK